MPGRYLGWLCLLLGMLEGPALDAQTAISWGSTSNGNWTNNGNWSGGSAPANDTTTNYAYFNNSTGVTVTVDKSRRVAGIEFGASAGTYTISKTSGGGNTLTVGSYGVINSGSADQTITGSSLRLTLGAATSFLVDGSGALTISTTGGTIATTATNTLTLGGDGTGMGTVGSVIAGAGSLTKTGTGSWTLSKSNTYTGATNIGTSGGTDAGTLILGANNVLPNTALNVYSGTLDINSRTDTVGAISLGGGASGTAANIIGTTGTLTLGGNVTYSAANNANGASIATNLNLGGAGRTITVNDSTAAATDLTLGAADFTDTITLGSSTLTVDGAGNTLINSTIGASGDTGGFTKNGTGTVTFYGNFNNYTGTTTVNEGTLVLDTSNSYANQTIRGNLVIGDGTGSATVIYGSGLANDKIADTSQVTINSDGTLNLNNHDDTIGSFLMNGGHVTTGTGVLTLNGNITTNASSSTAVFDGVLSLGNATRTFTVASGGLPSDLTINSTINFGSIIKAGAGTLTLTGDNSGGYGGTTTVNAGVLNIQNSLALGQTGANDPTKGTTVASGAALQLQGNIAVGTEALTLSGTGISNDGALRNISGDNSWAGSTSLAAATRINSDSGTLTMSGAIVATNQNLTVGGSGNTAISGAIGTGSGTLTKDGSGTLTLSGNSTYSGTTTVSAGVVNIQNSSALGSTSAGTTVASGAALQLQGGIAVGAEALSLSGTGVSNDGAMRNISDNNSWAGTVTLASASRINSDSGTLTLGGNVTGTNQNLTVGGAGNTTINGAITTGSGTLTKDGAGTLTLGGTNTYTGATTVSAGTLRLGASGAIANASAVSVASGATFDVNGKTNTVASLAGAGAVQLNSGTLTLAGATTDSFSGTLSGPGTLIRAGTGTTSIDGNLGFGGNLNITGGMLQVNVDNAFTGAVTLSAGTLQLTGTTNLDISTLNITGNSVIDFAGSNILRVTNLNISAGVTLTIRNWQDATDYFYTSAWSGAVFDLRSASPMNQVVFDTDGANPTTYTAAQTIWQSYDNQVTPVPEPSTYGAMLMGASLALLGLRRWRRNRGAV